MIVRGRCALRRWENSCAGSRLKHPTAIEFLASMASHPEEVRAMAR